MARYWLSVELVALGEPLWRRQLASRLLQEPGPWPLAWPGDGSLEVRLECLPRIVALAERYGLEIHRRPPG